MRAPVAGEAEKVLPAAAVDLGPLHGRRVKASKGLYSSEITMDRAGGGTEEVTRLAEEVARSVSVSTPAVPRHLLPALLPSAGFTLHRRRSTVEESAALKGRQR
jgi:hypothetical protein